MIVQQNKKRCENSANKNDNDNNNKNKNNKNNKNTKKRTSDREDHPTNASTSSSSSSNKKLKLQFSNNTYKDDTNDHHLYDYTYSLIQNEDILKIGTHNVQSFHNKVKQQQILNTVDNLKLDIFGISETNLTEKHIKHVARSLDKSYDYFFSAGDRRLGSGVGIIINKSISQHVFNSFGHKGRFIYIDLQMKNKTKLRVFQIYLQTSNYDIKDRMLIHQELLNHIQTALNNNYRIIVMGDFNVNPDKPKNETKYKRQYKIVQDLKNLHFFDLFDTIYDINANSPHNTWFNHSGSLESRIDMIWCSNNLINGLISCDSLCAESYTSDHKILLSFFNKHDLFGYKPTSNLKRQRIFKTKYHYDEMDQPQWSSFSKAVDDTLNKDCTVKKFNENYNYTTSDLNHLWQSIRTAIKIAAKEHIPNHKSYAQDKRFMPYALSVIYNNIKKVNKVYHKFHNSKIASNSFPSTED
jgi:exonuclease III